LKDKQINQQQTLLVKSPITHSSTSPSLTNIKPIRPDLNTITKEANKLSINVLPKEAIDSQPSNSTAQNAGKVLINSSNKSRNNNNNNSKKRGRPRLYEINPSTGKSMKGRLIDSKPLPNTLNPSMLIHNQQQQLLPHQTQLPIHLTNGITIYPSPSTSTASSTSSSSSTTGPTTFIINSNGLNLQTNGGVGINGNIPTASDTYLQAGLLAKQMGDHINSNYNDIHMKSTNQEDNETGDDDENENDQDDESVDEDGNVDEDDEGQSNGDGDEEMYDEQEQGVHEKHDLDENGEYENENDKNNNQKIINQKEEQKSITVKPTAKQIKKDEASCVLQMMNNNTSLKGHVSSSKEENKNKSSQIVLTHVIDGYVIKESTKPFPVKPTNTSNDESQPQEQVDTSASASTVVMANSADTENSKQTFKSDPNIEQSYSTPKQRAKSSANNASDLASSSTNMHSQSTSTNGKKTKASEKNNQNASVANTPPKSTSTPSSTNANKASINVNSANEALNVSISSNSVQSKGDKNRNRNNLSTASSTTTSAVNEQQQHQQQQQQQHSATKNDDSSSLLSSPVMKKSRMSASSSTNKKNKPSSCKKNNSKQTTHTNYEEQQRMDTTPISAATMMPNYAQSILLPPPPPPPPAASIQLPLTPISLPPQSSNLVSSHSQQSLSLPTLSPFTINSGPSNASNSSPGCMDQQLPMGDPAEWNCEEVYQFVKCVAGIQVAQLFKMQEVDGSALTLIRDDHLVNTMQIKLGPALKIMSKFNELKSKYISSN
jgi:hypothetical protein